MGEDSFETVTDLSNHVNKTFADMCKGYDLKIPGKRFIDLDEHFDRDANFYSKFFTDEVEYKGNNFHGLEFDHSTFDDYLVPPQVADTIGVRVQRRLQHLAGADSAAHTGTGVHDQALLQA